MYSQSISRPNRLTATEMEGRRALYCPPKKKSRGGIVCVYVYVSKKKQNRTKKKVDRRVCMYVHDKGVGIRE